MTEIDNLSVKVELIRDGMFLMQAGKEMHLYLGRNRNPRREYRLATASCDCRR